MLLLGPDVHGATIGIVGFGRIGQAVARRAQGFGMRILYHDVQRAARRRRRSRSGRRSSPLDELLAESDFVSLHVNLTDETRHLINARDAGLDEADGGARQHVARAGHRPGSRSPTRSAAASIWAAGLDVTDPEPIPMDDPLVGLDNCLIVPHIASASRATRGKMAAMAAANLLAGRSRRAAADAGDAARLSARRSPRYPHLGPVAQRQSTGLLIPWSWVRIPPGSLIAAHRSGSHADPALRGRRRLPRGGRGLSRGARGRAQPDLRDLLEPARDAGAVRGAVPGRRGP